MKVAMVLLGTIALVISAVLCIHAFNGRGLIGCSAGSSCNQVLGSRWSFVGGIIPISALAVFAYIIYIVTLLSVDRFEGDLRFSRFLSCLLMVVAGAIVAAAIWFIWLQKNYIRAFCPYCMTAHSIGIVVAVLTAVYLAIRRYAPLWLSALCLVGGLLSGVALAGVQLATTPRTAFERGFIPEDMPMLDPHSLPVVGDPDAEHVVTLLFDYQCSHCQRVHSMLQEVVDRLGGSVAFVTCPVPLSVDCNPYVPAGGEDRFKGSCELTEMALALWRKNQGAFRAYDAWLFEPDPNSGWYPRSVEDASLMAVSIVGEDALYEAAADPWIDDYLEDIFEVFGRTSTSAMAAVPRFIYGSEWVVPDVDDVNGLVSIIRNLINPQE